jgi:hypothetical protein
MALVHLHVKIVLGRGNERTNDSPQTPRFCFDLQRCIYMRKEEIGGTRANGMLAQNVFKSHFPACSVT